MPDSDQKSRRHYLAFDLGAGSGRVFLGTLQRGTLAIQEIHRFANGPIRSKAGMYWDASHIWDEMQVALGMVEMMGTRLGGVAVDAWGVDYALLDARGRLLQNPLHYRDPRNAGAMRAVLERIEPEEVYRRTGVQFMPINTLYQLFAAVRDFPEAVTSAEYMVMVPDYFRARLGGGIACEYTIASTSQFANPVTRDWDRDLLRNLGLPYQLPAQIVEPGGLSGSLRPEVSSSLAGTPVIIAASHDTASAVAAVDARVDTAFLSSGTWSLLGIELNEPVISAEAMRFNFTNEGGVCGTTRLLKNVMGLWMLEECRRQWSASGAGISYAKLEEAAMGAAPFAHLIDPDHASFLNPDDMPAAIDAFCHASHQPTPAKPAAYARAIFESLALKYRTVLENLETLTGRHIERVRVIGGGSKNRLLNQFTADATGKTVIAGPAEATVLGNIGVQIMATGEAASLAEMRAAIDRSFPVETFTPQDGEGWSRQLDRFREYCEIHHA